MKKSTKKPAKKPKRAKTVPTRLRLKELDRMVEALRSYVGILEANLNTLSQRQAGTGEGFNTIRGLLSVLSEKQSESDQRLTAAVSQLAKRVGFLEFHIVPGAIERRTAVAAAEQRVTELEQELRQIRVDLAANLPTE